MLRQIDPTVALEVSKPVSGGDINEAYYVRTSSGEFFVKLNRDADPSFFEFEKEGLEKIKEAKAIDVPDVYGIAVDEETRTPSLWMEWISGERKKQTEVWLGERLATLHQTEGMKFGWEGKSFIGKLEQENQSISNWLTYYRDFRIGVQLELGRNRGTISAKPGKEAYPINGASRPMDSTKTDGELITWGLMGWKLDDWKRGNTLFNRSFGFIRRP